MSDETKANRRKGSRRRRHLSLTPLRHVVSRLERIVDNSPADETELVWLECRRNRIAHRVPDAETFHRRERTVHARVREHGRNGSYRTSGTSSGEIAHAVRQAMAHTLTSDPRRTPPLPGKEEPEPPAIRGFDRQVARLSRARAADFLAEHARRDEAAILEWSEGQVAICNSRGLKRKQHVTAVALEVRSGLGTGAGFATHAARSLEQLGAEAVFERARRRRTVEPPANFESGSFEPGHIPLLLSSEATADLVEVLNRHAFAAHAYREGGSFLREHLGVQVFDQRLNLKDDGVDPEGLPFPFDLEGRSKRSVDFIRSGVPKTPAVDTRSAAEFGFEPTAHCAGGEQAFGLNLFLEPGDFDDQELLELADGGLWISRLERVECFDPIRVRLRTIARGVRKIEGGKLTHPIPDLSWEDSVLRVFSNFLGLGKDTRCRLSSDGLLGGISAPPVVIGEASDLELA